MVNIAFISVHIKKSPLSFPLSSAILAAASDSNQILNGKIKTEIINLFLEDTVSDAADTIINSGTDIAAFSIYIWNIDYIVKLISKLKKMKPDISVIAGGAEVTADPVFFAENTDIDWIVNGEGEEAITEYLVSLIKNKKPIDSFQSYQIRSEAEIAESDFRNKSKELSLLSSDFQNYKTRRTVSDPGLYPSPIIEHKIDLSNYEGILWELSRGCPFKCGFCFESRGSKNVRQFSLSRIKKELDVIKKSGINQVFVLDPTFNADRKRAIEILTLIKKETPDIHFTFEARSEYIDMETARLFSEITCSIQIGLQSSNPEVLKNVNRKIDIYDFYNKVMLLDEEGAVYGFDIIYGLPGDSYNKFLDSIDFAFSMAPNHLDIFPLAVLKGTDLYDKAEDFGIIYRKSDPYTVISTPDFPEEDLKKAVQIADGIELFYNRGKAVSFLPLILENLEINPSEFFSLFTEWLNINKLKNINIITDITQILGIQKGFIKYIFSEYSTEDQGLLASDIADAVISGKSFSGIYNIDKVLNYIDSGVTDFEELVFFSRN